MCPMLVLLQAKSNTVTLWTVPGLGLPPLPPVKNLHVIFAYPPDLTMDSLLLTRGLTDIINSQLIHSLYVTCITCYILTIKWEKKIIRANILRVLYCTYKKENTHMWTHIVQTHVLQGSTVYSSHSTFVNFEMCSYEPISWFSCSCRWC